MSSDAAQLAIDTRARPAARPTACGAGDTLPFAVYVHWPFCAAKCPYCDFNSHVRHGGIDEAAFRDAFLTEIETTARETGSQTVHSVFFGGGTPSLMPAATVEALIDRIASVWHLPADAEITLEANPTSVEAERFRGYRAAGVNRVSLGVQALNDADLRALGRLHSADEARAAVALANSVFERVSFDLIYARTGQSLAAWDAELGEALAMAAGHLSLYQLTIEPGTPFEKLHAAGRLVIPDEALADDMYALTGDRCAAAGLPLYEISNYARPGEESQHNLVYWRYGAYVGIGPGAHGRPVIDGSRYATRTEPHPETWLAQVGERGTGRVEMQKVSAAEAADEALLMGLRLAEGIDLTAFERRLGVALDAGTMAELTEAGLLMAPGPGRIAASPRGRFLLNRLVLELSETMKLVA